VTKEQAPSAAAWFLLGKIRNGGVGWEDWGRKVWAGTVSAKEGHDSGVKTRDDSARELSGIGELLGDLQTDGVELPDGSEGLEE